MNNRNMFGLVALRNRFENNVLKNLFFGNQKKDASSVSHPKKHVSKKRVYKTKT